MIAAGAPSGSLGSVTPGRNDACPCGSLRRYKDCCGRLAGVAPVQRPAPEPTASPRTVDLQALLEGGRYAELESAVRVALAAQPDSAPLWQLLGVACARQGKDALAALEWAVRYAPEDAGVHVNLGNALGRLGRLEDAAASYARALKLDSRSAEAHHNLAELHLECGRLEEALESSREALRSRPGFPEAHVNEARALLRLGRFAEAVRSCRRALALKSAFAEAHNTLGSALLELGRPEEAMDAFRRALELKADFAEAHANLAQALRGMGELDAAVAGYRHALGIKPHLALAHTGLATALRLQRRGEAAEASCREALTVDPTCEGAFVVLAELRADCGQFAAAEELLRRAISINPASAEAWAGLARLRRMTPADGAWLATTQRLVEQGLSPQREMLLRFAMGKYCDEVRNFAAAFANYQRANELAKRSAPAHDRDALARRVDLIIRAHGAAWVNEPRDAVPRSERPVFIVGMLRSGTTLAEQILASHPAVFGAGELTFWSGITGATFADASDPDVTRARMSDARVAALGNDYLQRLERLSPHARRVVDKLPTNFLSLGLIRAALPGARIIHLRRDPIDTCLSIYFQHFEVANTYTHDLGDLAHYYREYWRLMAHWRTVLPEGTLLEVPYEALVSDLRGWVGRMLEFIGVPWSSKCLDFELTTRPVVTASRWQVRQKLFGSSIGRWRHYERFIAPLLSLRELC
ncbi:MAG: sulfotransferase [Gammaproteobacteria bacterium]|nr:sulfotransferase [Gammaproteobacteria bacterium]